MNDRVPGPNIGAHATQRNRWACQMDDVLESIRREWTWVMPPPEPLLAVSKFGNVLVAVLGGAVWRICPEEMSCQVFAPTVEVAQQLMADPEFRED